MLIITYLCCLINLIVSLKCFLKIFLTLSQADIKIAIEAGIIMNLDNEHEAEMVDELLKNQCKDFQPNIIGMRYSSDFLRGPKKLTIYPSWTEAKAKHCRIQTYLSTYFKPDCNFVDCCSVKYILWKFGLFQRYFWSQNVCFWTFEISFSTLSLILNFW